MYTIRSYPPNQFGIIKEALKLYKENFWISLSFAFPATLAYFVPSFLTGSNVSLITKWDQNALQVLAIVFGWVVGILLQSALIFKVYCTINHSPCRWLSALQEAFYKLFSLLLLTALYVLMVLSGTMLLIIPGIILALSLSFSFILVIIENQTVLQNLTLSHRLVWGHWWYTAGLMLFVFLLNACAYMVLFLAVFTLCPQCDYQHFSTQVTFFAANVLLQTLFMPFIISTALLLLEDLRKRAPIQLEL